MHKTLTEKERKMYLFFGEEVLNQAIKNIENYNCIYHSLINGEFVFKQDKGFYREGLVHPDSTGVSKYQFSFFDKFGPIGDFKRDTLKEVAESLVEYGYIPMLEEDVQLLNSSEAVAHFKIPSTYFSLIKEKK
ncbi:hypothetical protein [Priestia megaterium]|uniref:Uncharacterized protein n=1 Tax=Priestia megaterium TaxID=1404 RepID=A0A6M6E2R4_PRIMG|nr:hypothetical protein [Priestia megaterium]QJX80016.1 hypothetical protein FDZ14_28340 [Priestia megaterium]